MTSLSASPIAVPGVIARTARWQVLIGAVMVQLILGTLYCYSVFWQPLESEL